jgi:AcrR family transcriptional regulator
MADPPAINLDTKLRPSQARGQDTYEIVLATAGKMLGDMGFEQLTTNAICERAGLTPPALYRYFPNKYAILKVLGERLMAQQDALILAWIDRDGLAEAPLDEAVERGVALQRQIIDVTQRFPGGVAIGRAMRAVPMLQRLRYESRDRVAEQLFRAIHARFPEVPEPRLRVVTRMLGDLNHAATEMVIEEPERDADLLNYEVCLLFALYFQSFRQPLPGNSPYPNPSLPKE